MASSAPAKPKARAPPALPAKLPPCGFLVTATKKGSLPVSVEKRPKGKKVTIISNIQGSAASLLSSLSSLLGCGGTKRQEASGIHWTVEIQGDQTERVLAALTQLGCLKGVKKESDEKQDKKQVEVATRQCAYDKFLRRGDEDRKGELLAEFRQGTLLPGAECSKWHGAWLYCRGNCERTDTGDVWEEGLCGEDDGRHAVAVPPPSSTAELNLALRSLGMLAEVGFAARSGQQRNPAATGLSLADYKRQAVGPGARLVDDEAAPGAVRGAALRRAASRAKSRSRGGGAAEGPAMVRSRSCGPPVRVDGRASAPAPSRRPAPPAPTPAAKQGVYRCLICGSTFGLQKTLKLHRRNAHPGVVHPAAEASSSLAAAHRPAAVRGSANTLGPARPAPWSPPHSPTPQASPPAPSAPARAAPASQPARPASAAAAKAKARTSECPLCYMRIPVGDAYEAHVQACCALADVQGRAAYGGAAARGRPSEASSDDSAEEPEAVAEPAGAGFAGGGPTSEVQEGEVDLVRLVRASFVPDRSEEGTEVQITVQEGEVVRVTWLQPREEGGYWAYVEQPKGAQGYVPASCLHAAREDPAEAGTVPESWIESFLQLDLPPERADRFWRTYSDLQRRLGMMEAWLAAFSQACDSMPSAGILVEPAGGGPDDVRGGFGQASAEAPTGRELRRWAEEEAERLAQQEHAERRRAALEARRARQAFPGAGGPAAPAGAAGCARPSGGAAASRPAAASASAAGSAEPPREETAAAAAAAAEAAVAEGEQPFGHEPVLVAARDFAAEGDSQVGLRAGDRVRVEWVQPQAEGGFWAYGEVVGGGGGPVGYFPAAHVRPETAEEAAASRAAARASAARAATPAAAAAPSAAAPSAAAAAAKVSAEASAPAPLHAAGAAAVPAAAGHSWRQRRAVGKSKQAVGASAGDAASVAAGAGPDGAPGAADAARGCDAAAGGSPESLAANARQAALRKLAGMLQRYCRERLDPDVVYDILIASKSVAEMREEAKNIIADNQVVDNFVAELWRKSSERTGHRPCPA